MCSQKKKKTRMRKAFTALRVYKIGAQRLRGYFVACLLCDFYPKNIRANFTLVLLSSFSASFFFHPVYSSLSFSSYFPHLR